MTRSVARELILSRYLVSGMRVAPLVVGAIAAMTLLAYQGGVADTIGRLRVIGLLLALASGFVLDDAAATTLQASPYSLARRLWLRIGYGATVIAGLWTIALVRLLPAAPAHQRATLGLGVTVELAAALTIVWAAAASGRRRGVDEPGIATAPVLLGLIFVGAAQQRFPLLVGLGADWLRAHLGWTVILAVAIALLAYEIHGVPR